MKALPSGELKPLELPRVPDNPFVSVLIANYNYAKYIGEAIESMLCQTYPHFEVIICDDGSTDNSCEIVEGYIQRDPRVKLVRKQNGGVSSALNKAFSESKGLILCLLDADDYYSPEKLDRVVQAFITHPESGMVLHPLMRVDASGSHGGRYPLTSRLPQGWLGPQAVALSTDIRYLPPASGISIRQEVALKIFPINEKFRAGADCIVERLGLLLTPVTAVDDVLGYYRLHGSNVTNLTTNLSIPTYLEKRRKGVNLSCDMYDYIESWVNINSPNVQLAPLESNFGYIESQYVISRLAKEPRAVQSLYYQRLLAHPQTALNVLYYFYKLSWWLPPTFFKLGLDIVYGQGPVKALLSRLITWKKRR